MAANLAFTDEKAAVVNKDFLLLNSYNGIINH